MTLSFKREFGKDYRNETITTVIGSMMSSGAYSQRH